ncbi:MAG: XdhC/CoxI family protein [Candidatus Euphemobacter frigidus]|nr:XdhC/CoxI family protein [Candidatus Euphemobacter frigidus]MDP8276675.1 XdhC/CoxI family protein [Candidatus Euphemobacter frigidus]
MLEIYKELVSVTSKGERAILATVISSSGSAPRKAGAKMLIKDDGAFIGTVGGGGVELQVREKAIEIMNSGESQLAHFDLSGRGEQAAMICGGQMDIFLDPILSPETLYLFGAGHISQSTAAIGKLLEFRVVVIDPRPEYNNAERFPDAESLMVEEYNNAFSRLSVDKNGYIVIYTPGHALDEQCLQLALGTKAKYIGMIGSKKKVKEIKERLSQKGVSRQKLNKVYAPIGLDIGAETPQEIALSILAEIIKVKKSVS